MILAQLHLVMELASVILATTTERNDETEKRVDHISGLGQSTRVSAVSTIYSISLTRCHDKENSVKRFIYVLYDYTLV